MQNPSKIDKKSTKNRPKISLGGVSGGPWGLLAAKIEKRRVAPELLGPLGAILGPSWGPLGAVLALGSPSWGVLGRLGALLSRLKIDVKIDQKIDAFQDRFLDRFWWIFEGKMRHVGTKIEQKSMPTSKSDFLKKPRFSMGKTMILRVQGIEVGGKNR